MYLSSQFYFVANRYLLACLFAYLHEIISTASQAENVYDTVRTINNKELYDILRRGFEANYKVYESIETERTELTTVRKKPNEQELSLINLIAKQYLDKETSSKQLSFELIYKQFDILLRRNCQTLPEGHHSERQQ